MSGATPSRSVAILVDDLATWLSSGLRPTGIQRVVSELLLAAYATPHIDAWPAICLGGTEPDDRIELVRIARDSLAWEGRRGPASVRLRYLRWARAVLRRLPLPVTFRERTKAAYERLALRLAGIRSETRAEAERAELLLVPGGFWMHPETPLRIRRLAEAGLSVRMIVYDVFPATHPEWVPSDYPRHFEQALDAIVPVCDVVVVLSKLVSEDVAARYPDSASAIRIAVPRLEAHAPRSPELTDASAAPVEGAFILALSTVEPRKNYRAILDAWRIAREDPRIAEASLAVVGRRGWMAEEIEAEIERDGERLRIRRLERATDGEVEALYRECLATVHASWAEGFGLPVRESVVRGIPTLMSSGIPQDGLPAGSFSVFDPADVNALASLMVKAIVGGHVRTPITLANGTGWEPVLSALIE